ncbi:MAG: 2Fe-2S iron-sulfur cluster binding domain-containing protein, partial [Rubrivivax sp.]|nr:2Fe-2S iron-sulfur cluster binding domain-containing protein [Rubrivivax sp.]
MEPRPIRFFHRGAVVEIADAAPTRTVLEWLREDARCTGTKEGCAEGDCGACTVVVGELDATGDVSLQPVNACIRFLPTLDGKALFTVEDVATPDGTLHPVQQA